MNQLKIYIVLLLAVISVRLSATKEDSSIECLLQDSAEIIPIELDRSLDSVLNSWYLQNSALGDCRKDTGFVLFPDSVYIKRLQKLPYVMEMSYNAPVRNFINFYAKKPKQVEYMLGIGQQYYFPLFEQALAANGVPLELKYLPVIESALNAKALSRVGAGGLWQFMIGTGRLYGLEVNSLVDERCDPVKSTMAAARYLNDLYSIYKDWHLVIAAYNCGPGNVNKAINRSGGKRNYWDIYPYLPRETRSYVPIFIAANYIMNYYEQHNMCPMTPTIPTVTDTLMISKRMHLKQISDVLQIPITELRTLNPQYKHDLIPGNIKPYALVLPFNQINAFLEKEDTIIAYKADELTSQQAVVKLAQYDYASATFHKVRSGDTLGGIAKKYRVSVSQLKKWNNLRGSIIRVGQRLRICR